MLNRLGPSCPNCGAWFTSVVLTKNAIGGERIRRRHCKHCDHRFYTEQNQERVLEPWQIAWSGVEPEVLRRTA
jgi:transcriptional regulator NrdR family protein